MKNSATKLVYLKLTIISQLANGAIIGTINPGFLPTEQQTSFALCKQSSGIGRCSLTIATTGIMQFSCIEYNENAVGGTFDFVYVAQ